MKCPYCAHDETKVVDSRESEQQDTRRRRECLKCEKRFTTYERVELVDLYIIKKDGRREQYDRTKLKNGLLKALQKRPISHEQIDKAVDEIEMEIRNMDTTEIPSKVLGNLVMEKLKNLDKVAYIRFASVYREFEDLGEFEKELKILRKGEGN